MNTLAKAPKSQDAILTSLEGQQDLPRYFRQAYTRATLLNKGRLDVVMPDGRTFRMEGAAPGYVAELHVHDADLFGRLIREGDVGFAESYMEGGWSSPDLQAFMDLVSDDNPSVYDEAVGMRLVRLVERARHWLRSNSKTQARKNISYHYDLGNDFYGLWLDDSMTYSSALFSTGQESLEAAQEAKYCAMVDRMGVKQGDHVLEIGCGWGGFAEYAAAKRGLKVTGLTISAAQRDYAVARMVQAGLSDQVEIRMQDYRDTGGEFDGIASIEMFEAVGEKYWPRYFNAVCQRLKPGAQAVIQIIMVPDDRFSAYRNHVDFIQKYIFPGGMLGAPGPVRKVAETQGLRYVETHDFGQSYSETLRRWNESFQAHWPEISEMGYDARFKRMWEYYLTSCAGAFRSGLCDVTQLVLQKPKPG
ncbi:cyclopropane-fatty-acyl-phospholipid synthase [Roseinatronobacter thiooxidans]|uniref:Cyclopropane-fatty-acyl-phospholipid synthase n=1 Tax=Roseinatronobacter thiooxidans TaxID=121821 RepID=A0A2W7R1S6_9RHOB|nr:cyclopropane-fatty-acyl-phospholipid synthase family protein [Roseinatronobacter thiooxidans]PZX44585.1 cyclopropane-fatty-acyl-phospholipid synthase [Roseinatronobacter thiooxidans]